MEVIPANVKPYLYAAAIITVLILGTAMLVNAQRDTVAWKDKMPPAPEAGGNGVLVGTLPDGVTAQDLDYVYVPQGWEPYVGPGLGPSGDRSFNW